MLKILQKTRQSLTKWALLLCLAFVSVVTVQAKSSYGLKVGNVRVTSDNCNDLSVIDGVSGTVTYDNATKTLTLNNATIDMSKSNKNCIYNSSITDLKIKVIGKNTIKSNIGGANLGIYLDRSTIIEGDGKSSLKITSYSYSCIGVENEKTLTIKDVSLELEGNQCICGSYSSAYPYLKVDNASIKATGKKGSIVRIKELNLNNCKIVAPEGAKFNKTKKAVTDASNNIIKTQIVIEPFYGLKIAGKDVTNKNCNDLSVIDGVSGKVTYDNETKTLTLDGATIDSPRLNGIENNIVDGLTILLKNDNIINIEDEVSMYLKASTTITGSGTLNTNGDIYIDKTSVTIKDTKVTINNENTNGIDGRSGNSYLTVDNSTLKVKGGDEGAVVWLSGLTLKSCAITLPKNAKFEDECIQDANSDIAEEVVIEPFVKYDLQVAGKDVTDKNCNDLSVIDGVTGKITYDNATKTLTLDNANIKVEEEYSCGIRNEVENLKINLIGNNKIEGLVKGYSQIFSMVSMQINGNGSLALKGGNNIELDEDKDLTIKDCSLDLLGETNIYNKLGNINLIINNATIKAKASDTKKGSFSKIKNLELKDCAIIKPVGSKLLDDMYYNIVDAEGNAATEILIEPSGTGINNTYIHNGISLYPNPAKDVLNINIEEVSTIQKVEIYNTAGSKVLEVANKNTISVKSLLSGVYFVKATTDKGIYMKRFIKK